MLFLLSPAKSLDYETPVPEGLPHTTPQFVPQSTALIEVLRTQSPQQIASLMDLSDALSALNVARYAAWSPRSTLRNARPAVLAFNGDVYEGLQARTLPVADLAASFQKGVTDCLVEKLEKAATDYGYTSIALAGGVSANSRLRRETDRLCRQKGWQLHLPALKYCGDNGAMVGAQGYYEYVSGVRAQPDLNAYATMPIDRPTF